MKDMFYIVLLQLHVSPSPTTTIYFIKTWVEIVFDYVTHYTSVSVLYGLCLEQFEPLNSYLNFKLRPPDIAGILSLFWQLLHCLIQRKSTFKKVQHSVTSATM